MTEIKRFSDNQALALGAAQHIAELVKQRIASNGHFNLVLSGGSTPKQMFAILAADYASAVDWQKVHIFWEDERTVPPDHPDSNFKMANDALLKHLPIPPQNIYRMAGELPPAEAALQYEDALRHYFGTSEAYPHFDLILLGIGDDGHTASLFPHTTALQEANRWVVENHVPKLDTWRITFTAGLINAASNVVFVVSGAAKADALREVLNGPYLPDVYPAQLVEPVNGTVTWFVDEAAAALI